MSVGKGDQVCDSCNVNWSSDSSYLGQGDIMKVDPLTTILMCVVRLAEKRLAEVYCKIYPGNMIQQLILLKIEYIFKMKNLFYFITINE